MHANKHYLLLKITLVSVGFLSVESAELIRRIISLYPHCGNIGEVQVQVFTGEIHQKTYQKMHYEEAMKLIIAYTRTHLNNGGGMQC